jgi:aconitase A
MSDAVDTLKTKRTLEHDGVLYEYFSLYEATRHIGDVSHLPFSLKVVAVLSGNRNFEGRISPHVKASYLALPALVVVFALTGTMRVDLTTDAIGADDEGTPVYLKDIWPSNGEISDHAVLLGAAST